MSNESKASTMTDGFGVPVVPPCHEKTVISPKKKPTLCPFWKHEYVLNGQMVINKVSGVPIEQFWECQKCGRLKYTTIERS